MSEMTASRAAVQAFLDSYDVKGYMPEYVEGLASLIDLAAAAEREACAKIAEDHDTGGYGWLPNMQLSQEVSTAIAAAIRARKGGA